MQKLPDLLLPSAERKRRAEHVAAVLADVLSEPDMLLSKLQKALKVRERERDAAVQSPSLRGAPADDIAIQRFASWMARGRTLFGLSRRILAGRRIEVRSLVDRSLRAHGIPHVLTAAVIDRLSAPQVILGFACRRMIAGMDRMQGLIVRLVQDQVGCLRLSGGEPPSAPDRARSPSSHFATKSRIREKWNREIMCAGTSVPEISIIVPFYNDGRFIDAVTTMQVIFEGIPVEWIIVCNEPSVSADLRQYLNRRRTVLSQRTILILNKVSCGCALASAIGAEAASGEFLLFMRSNIWIDGWAGMNVALQALRSAEFGIIGFRLLYEDGTIQHDGFQIKRNPYFHNLFIPASIGKGLPPRCAQQKAVERVEAVSSALMIMRRKLFTTLGGFRPDYVEGDFEDVDLCLRAAREGHDIGLVVTDECYHLECLSVRPKEAKSVRYDVNYINCVKFNDDWGDYLDRSLAPAGAPMERLYVGAPP